MAGYQIVTFGDLALPLYNSEQNPGPGAVDSTLMDSLGGVFDYAAARVMLPRMATIQVSGVYSGELDYHVDGAGNNMVTDAGDFRIFGTGANRLRSQLDELKRQIGQRKSLWRVRLDDESIRQWLTARLLSVDGKLTAELGRTLADVTCVFEAAMVAWRDEAASTASVVCVTNGPNALWIENGGLATIEDAVFTFTASGTVTSVRVTAAGVDWTWTGSLPSGNTLVVDAGGQTVIANGANGYSGFVLAAGHVADGWLPLAVGSTMITVTVVGTGTAKVDWYNQWL